jgi:FkbM family methyltransferase
MCVEKWDIDCGNDMKNYENVVDYISSNDVEELIRNREELDELFRTNKYQEFVECYKKWFLGRNDYFRYFFHHWLERIVKKPYLDVFEREMLPAVYEDDGIELNYDTCVKGIKDNIELIKGNKYIDEKSYNVIWTALHYRLSSDKTVLFKYTDYPELIYFDTTIPGLMDDSMFKCMVDCGAYIGDTIEMMKKNAVSFKKIYAIEANPDNYRALDDKYGKEVFCVNAAVGDESGFVDIYGEADGSTVRKNGEGKIPLVRLDDIIDESISFIKLDIEGGELRALKGAREHIVKDKPKLAISIYHKNSDIYAIQSYLMDLDMGYRFAARHYGNTATEFVLYAF